MNTEYRLEVKRKGEEKWKLVQVYRSFDEVKWAWEIRKTFRVKFGNQYRVIRRNFSDEELKLNED